MASTAQPPENAFLHLITHLHPFQFPYFRTINVEQQLQRLCGDPRTAELVRRVNSSRRILSEALTPSIQEPRYILNLIDRYLPDLFQLSVTLQSQPEVVQHLQIFWEWGSGFDGMRGRSYLYRSIEIEYEVIIALSIKAIALGNCAVDLIHQNRNTSEWAQLLPQAADLFKSAAGIFQYIFQDRIPRLMDVGSAEKPPEADRYVCESLMHYYLAQSQQLAIARSMVSTKPKLSLLAKLCFGVVHQFEQFVVIGRNQALLFYGKFPRPMLVHVAFHQYFYRAAAFKFLAEAAQESSKYGESIVYMAKASKCLQTRNDSSSPGLPPLSGPLESLSSDLVILRDHIASLVQTLTADNQKVYFDTVPDESSLPPEPEGIVMMTPNVFQVPEDNLIPLPLINSN